jgi:O-methyltransferase
VSAALSREELEGDYVRSATLELLCKRLVDIPGAAAELGVYKGPFAQMINKLLPDRKLYLFDSFQGFAENAGASDSMQAAHENSSDIRERVAKIVTTYHPAGESGVAENEKATLKEMAPV